METKTEEKKEVPEMTPKPVSGEEMGRIEEKPTPIKTPEQSRME